MEIAPKYSNESFQRCT